jgi:hypothetical protein
VLDQLPPIWLGICWNGVVYRQVLFVSMPCREYRAFRVSTDGELQGIGLLLETSPGPSGHLRVLAPIRGGPAERAGIMPGDEVCEVTAHLSLGLVYCVLRLRPHVSPSDKSVEQGTISQHTQVLRFGATAWSKS